MKIAVVGSGALGCLLGAFFSRAGHKVAMIARDPETARKIREKGILLHEEGHKSRIPVAAPAPGEEAEPCDLVIVAVKAFDTEGAAETARPLLAPGAVALTLQNGLGPADILADHLGSARVLAGITAQGATLLGPGEVRHGGAGETLIGGHNPRTPPRDDVVGAFNGAGIYTRWEPDIGTALWKKLVASCGINALTALTGVKNGRVAEHPEARELCREAVREAAKVASALGIVLGDPAALAEWVLGIARVTAANRSSMGQDVDRKRRTEIAYINGAVARLGAENGVETPVNRTLYRLVSTLEAGFTAP